MTDALAPVRSAALASYRSITFITTYQCTAACRECCFESSPTLKSNRLDSATMTRVIDEAAATLPNLGLVVFSGGECFMLKEELFKTIAFATEKGLMSRCVTNGYWGKTPAAAKRTATRLKQAGISEINLSTGLEHQEWVPLDSIIHCVDALTDEGIFTLVTVEKDTDTSGCWKALSQHPTIQRLLQHNTSTFCLSSNAWMPFHTDAQSRSTGPGTRKTECDQLFSNLVITPYKRISACCGLTFEHIPELQVGTIGDTRIGDAVNDITDDFLKIWLHIDGPTEIVRKIGSEEDICRIEKTVHICQACAVLHQSAPLRAALKDRYAEFVPDVMARFVFNKALRSMAGAAIPRQ